MEGQTNWIHTMGAGILFFLFLLLFSPKAAALTKESSALLLQEAAAKAQEELYAVQAEQARRTQEYKATLDELALEFPITAELAMEPQQVVVKTSTSRTTL